ncbi:progranulin [Parasteatoda tepidariorum]|uniref:progranulin n=1 Tax=Parasteatoda tepidariorum TaxID=114398 RepID=UPI001C720464|nr:progranulin [Parasteatoda tepidariorum]
MKVLFAIVGMLCLAFLASAEQCADGEYCSGVGRCCYAGGVCKCAPVDNSVCCPGGDYSCPPGKTCVEILKWFICVKMGAPTSDGSFDLQKQLAQAVVNDKCHA